MISYPVLLELRIGSDKSPSCAVLMDSREPPGDAEATVDRFLLVIELPNDSLVGRVVLRGGGSLVGAEIAGVKVSKRPTFEENDTAVTSVSPAKSQDEFVVVSERSLVFAAVCRSLQIAFTVERRADPRCFPTTVTVEGFSLNSQPHGSRSVSLLNLCSRLQLTHSWSDASKGLIFAGLSVLNGRRFIQSVELFRLAQTMIFQSLPESLRTLSLLTATLSTAIDASVIDSWQSLDENCTNILKCAHEEAAVVEILCADAFHQHGEFSESLVALSRFVILSVSMECAFDVKRLIEKHGTADGSLMILQPELLPLLLEVLHHASSPIRAAASRVLLFVIEGLGCDLGNSVPSVLNAIFQALSEPSCSVGTKESLLKCLEAIFNVFVYFSRKIVVAVLRDSIVPLLLADAPNDVRLLHLRAFIAVIRSLHGDCIVDWGLLTRLLDWIPLDQGAKGHSVGSLSRRIWQYLVESEGLVSFRSSDVCDFFTWSVYVLSSEFAEYIAIQKSYFLQLFHRVVVRYGQFRLGFEKAVPGMDGWSSFVMTSAVPVYDIFSHLSTHLHQILSRIPVSDGEMATSTEAMDQHIDLLTSLWTCLQSASVLFSRFNTVDDIICSVLAQCTSALRLSSPSRNILQILSVMLRAMHASEPVLQQLRQFVAVFSQWIPLNINNEVFEVYFNVLESLIGTADAAFIERTVDILVHKLTVRSKAYRTFRHSVIRSVISAMVLQSGDAVELSQVRCFTSSCLQPPLAFGPSQSEVCIEKILLFKDFIECIRSMGFQHAESVGESSHSNGGSRPSSAGRFRTPRLGIEKDMRRISTLHARSFLVNAVDIVSSSCLTYIANGDAKLRYEAICLVRVFLEVLSVLFRTESDNPQVRSMCYSATRYACTLAVEVTEHFLTTDPESVFACLSVVYRWCSDLQNAQPSILDASFFAAGEPLDLLWNTCLQLQNTSWRNLKILSSCIMGKIARAGSAEFFNHRFLPYFTSVFGVGCFMDDRLAGLLLLSEVLARSAISNDLLLVQDAPEAIPSAVFDALFDSSQEVRMLAFFVWTKLIPNFLKDRILQSTGGHSLMPKSPILSRYTTGSFAELHNVFENTLRDPCNFVDDLVYRQVPLHLWDEDEHLASGTSEHGFEASEDGYSEEGGDDGGGGGADGVAADHHGGDAQKANSARGGIEEPLDHDQSDVEEDELGIIEEDEDPLGESEDGFSGEDPFSLDQRIVYSPSNRERVEYRGRLYDRSQPSLRRRQPPNAGFAERRRSLRRPRRAGDNVGSSFGDFRVRNVRSTRPPGSSGDGGLDGDDFSSSVVPEDVAWTERPSPDTPLVVTHVRQSFQEASDTESDHMLIAGAIDDDLVEYGDNLIGDEADHEGSPDELYYDDVNVVRETDGRDFVQSMPSPGSSGSDADSENTGTGHSNMADDDSGVDPEGDVDGRPFEVMSSRVDDLELLSSSSAEEDSDTEYLYMEGTGVDLVSELADECNRLPPGVRVSVENVDLVDELGTGIDRRNWANKDGGNDGPSFLGGQESARQNQQVPHRTRRTLSSAQAVCSQPMAAHASAPFHAIITPTTGGRLSAFELLIQSRHSQILESRISAFRQSHSLVQEQLHHDR
eukprot:ANDGO_00117.mRNA.1 hypothetical protein TTHERM_00529940